MPAQVVLFWYVCKFQYEPNESRDCFSNVFENAAAAEHCVKSFASFLQFTTTAYFCGSYYSVSCFLCIPKANPISFQTPSFAWLATSQQTAKEGVGFLADYSFLHRAGRWTCWKFALVLVHTCVPVLYMPVRFGRATTPCTGSMKKIVRGNLSRIFSITSKTAPMSIPVFTLSKLIDN